MLTSRQNCIVFQMRLFRQGKQEAAQDLENYFLLRIFKSPYDGPIFPKRTMDQGERNFFIELQAEYALKLELMSQGREFAPGTPPECLLFDIGDDSDTEPEFVKQAFADFIHGRKRDLAEMFLHEKVSEWLDRAKPLSVDERQKRKEREKDFESKVREQADPTKISHRQKVQKLGEEFLQAI